LKFHIYKTLFAVALILGAIQSPSSFADEAEDDSAVESPEEGVKEVDVKGIKQKYWAKGKKTKMGVVQNRKFTKAGRIEAGVFGGIINTDPFLAVNSVGARVGYHFDETFALSLYGWKDFTRNSSAADAFRQNSGGAANTNIPKSYLGTEVMASLLYGKLSLLGAKIIYYDMYATLGGGLRKSETDTDIAGSTGIGQRFFLSQRSSLRLDYRVIMFSEEVPEKVIPTLSGTTYPRTNITHSITLGVDFFFGK